MTHGKYTREIIGRSRRERQYTWCEYMCASVCDIWHQIVIYRISSSQVIGIFFLAPRTQGHSRTLSG